MDQLVEGIWARESFGEAQLGDPRRTERLVSMAEAAARLPAGKVTQVFASSADREGAFRLLENDAVSSKRVAEAVFDATARRCAEEPFVYVAVDGTSLTFTDHAKKREIGRVGPRFYSRGLHVMNALAVDERGAAIGLVEQRWWSRTRKVRDKKIKCVGNKHLKKESRYWLDALTLCDKRMQESAPRSRAWYQLDRGADCWLVVKLALKKQLLITVRSVHDRLLLKPDGSNAYLRATLSEQKILGHYEIDVPARPGRPARVARMAVRACSIVIQARVRLSNRREPFPFNAVLAEEVDYAGKDRIRWVLLTTAPVKTFKEARAVVFGYAMRWRIEDFHRVWKRGLCNVEDSQLQSQNAIVKWATILAAVASRALRVANLIRTTPDIPATEEFSEFEIDAAFLFAKKKRDRRRKLVLSEVVDIIADIGGFAHKYSRTNNLPGPTVLARGLERIRIVALALQNQADLR
jgi:Transposase DNA-binding